MSATFLVTGFEPFREHRTNSSWDALAQLAPSWPEGIVARLLPVDHGAAHLRLRQALEELRPRAVLLTGLAKGNVFRIERRARRPRELGTEAGTEVLAGGWPWDEMKRELDESGVSVLVSDDAGQYVCESTYWSLLSYREIRRVPEFAGFLHVPHESETNPLDRIANAVGRVVSSRWYRLSADHVRDASRASECLQAIGRS